MRSITSKQSLEEVIPIYQLVKEVKGKFDWNYWLFSLVFFFSLGLLSMQTPAAVNTTV